VKKSEKKQNKTKKKNKKQMSVEEGTKKRQTNLPFLFSTIYFL